MRSPHAHARFRVVDRDRALRIAGVKAVLAASDLSALGSIQCLAPTRNSDGTFTPLKPYPVMASEEAQHVGDIVAIVVAESAFAARDGAEALGIDWESLPAVVDSRVAIEPGAVQIFSGAPGNIASDAHIGDKAWLRRRLAWMAKPYSRDLRERMVRAVQAGRSRREVARMLPDQTHAPLRSDRRI